MGWFQKLSAGLSKTRDAVTGQLDRFLGRAADPALLDELRGGFDQCGSGPAGCRACHGAAAGPDARWQFLIRRQSPGPLETIRPRYSSADTIRLDESISVAGAAAVCHLGRGREDGVGKTTTIAKLTQRFCQEGKTSLLVAGDTFRAAAIDQLQVWADRIHVDVIRHRPGANPAAVAYDGMTAAKARGSDIVLIDTAGRLHTKTNLMEELRKIKRVVAQECQGAPHEVLLVLDATVGQNAIAQARQFHEAVGVTGIALTKLDGTARGGIVVAIADTFKIPVRLIGVGESVEDLQDFDAKAFVDALF